MTAERWQQVARLYETALAREPKERAAFVEAATSDDAELRREVEALLAQEHAPLVIDRSIGAVAGSVIEPSATLAPNAQLGPYRIEALLGAGGMGQVYRATDTRLNRTVAIKLLPRALAGDPQFRARFEREAQAIAGLAHPHVCTLHDVGEHAGTSFLVLEYLEGESLAARLERGALPFDQALACAIQIADALDAAHRRGIVHRDLKPGNIMLVRSAGPSGPPTAKLLDFGLAKPAAPAIAGMGPSDVPTTPPPLTAQGTILGTFQYMAPEQLEGREADTRTDILAFGAVVYEMFTGKKAFEGKSQASLIGAIMHADPPPLSASVALSPPSLDHIVRTCLAKSPEDRWQTTRDLARELSRVRAESIRPPAGLGQVTRPRFHARGAVVVAGITILASVLTGFAVWKLKPVDVRRVARFAVTLPSDHLFVGTGRHVIAISPDGAQIAYAANNSLYVRRLDQLEARIVPGTAELPPPRGVTNPFFSPDGQWIGFWYGGQLRKVPTAGGAALVLCEAQNPWGVSWATDGWIWYGQGAAGIWRVPDSGGQAENVIKLESPTARAHNPQVLPGGRTILYTLAEDNEWDSATIAAQSLETGSRTTLIRGGTDARYVPTGHLVYVSRGKLLTVPFDVTLLRVTSGPVALVEDVGQSTTLMTGAAQFGIATDGTLVYVPASSSIPRDSARELVWIDRQGREETTGIAGPFFYPRLSPDGSRVAVENRGASASDVLVVDLTRRMRSRITFEPRFNRVPLWIDARRLAFNSTETGGNSGGLAAQAADGLGGLERLTDGPDSPMLSPTGMTPDGSAIVLTQDTAGIAGRDIMLLALTAPRQVRPLVQTRARELNGVVSPDGRWLAYESDSGEPFRSDIYVRPFPDAASGMYQVTTTGGMQPLWSRDGRELFYVTPAGQMMAVPVEPGALWRPAQATQLFGGDFAGLGGQFTAFRSYDVSPDGKRFLMLKENSQTSGPRQIIVVQNWHEELKQRVPAQ